MTVLEIGLAAVLITENLAILLFSVLGYDPPIGRDRFDDQVEESMRRRA